LPEWQPPWPPQCEGVTMPSSSLIRCRVHLCAAPLLEAGRSFYHLRSPYFSFEVTVATCLQRLLASPFTWTNEVDPGFLKFNNK
jgi:hypothetical protein